MYGALSAALPLALAAAVSPGLLAIVLLILASEERPRARAWFYLLGVLMVVLIVTLIGWTTVRAVVDEFERMPVGLSVAVRFSLCLALAVLGWRYLRPNDDPAVLRRLSWEDRLRAASPQTFLVVGVGTMLTNWSSLLLYLSALEVVKSAQPGLVATMVASVAVLVIMLSPLVFPVLTVTVVGHRADPFLARLRGSVDRHSRQIIASIYFLIAVLVAGSVFTDVLQ
jgi:Sap, sulfolipid-1-addressing protein